MSKEIMNKAAESKSPQLKNSVNKSEDMLHENEHKISDDDLNKVVGGRREPVSVEIAKPVGIAN